MEDLCSDGQLENAECCCACKFPLPLFCTQHISEHQAKDPGLHFTLPLSAVLTIPSRQVYFQVTEWLYRLSANFAALREKVMEFCREEEKIEAVYQEIQHCAHESKVRLLKEFSVAKTALQTVVESAIKETSTHALESFVPMDPISHLLYYYSPSDITGYQLYTFQANSGKEKLNSAFEVELHFTVPGFEDLDIRQPVQLLSECRETVGDYSQLEKEIQDLKRQLQTAQTEIQDLRRENVAKDLLISDLQKENLAVQVQVLTADLERKCQQLGSQANELEALHAQISVLEKKEALATFEQEKVTFVHQLQAKEAQLLLTEARCSALKTENERLETLLTEKEMVISATEVSAREELAVTEDQHRMQVEGLMRQLSLVPESVEKLIAVLPDEVQCFDVATGQWQQLFALRPAKRIFARRQPIHVDESTSSILMNDNRIFVCGGGGTPCTCYADNHAYVLEGDGTIQILQHMRTGRYSHGLAWDSARKAVYAFGGSHDNTCTCYAVLRSSEQFQANKWTTLPDMHHARRYFNPCWYSSVVYLCGGWTNSVETYEPQSNSFRLQDFALPEALSCTSVVECGVLTVISWNYISKLQQGRFTSQQHTENNPWSTCTPVVSKGLVYIVDIPVCRCINLTTGQVEKEVSLS